MLREPTPIFWRHGALEGLAQSDVDLEDVVSLLPLSGRKGSAGFGISGYVISPSLPLGGNGNVKSNMGADGRVVADTHADAHPKVAGQRLQAGADLAGVDEYRAAKILREALAPLQAACDDGSAPIGFPSVGHGWLGTGT